MVVWKSGGVKRRTYLSHQSRSTGKRPNTVTCLFSRVITIVGVQSSSVDLPRRASVHFMQVTRLGDITFSFLILAEVRYLPSYTRAPPTPTGQNL